MISGRVERNELGGLEPRLAVSVMDARGELQQFEVVLDTGFTGSLMLPEADINRLGLVREGPASGYFGPAATRKSLNTTKLGYHGTAGFMK